MPITNLNEGWEFKKTDAPDHSYLPVSQFPTNIHLDLIHHKLIPNPNFGKNEELVQWIGETAWDYRLKFKAPSIEPDSKIMIQFDGLDTFVEGYLNGSKIMKSSNMFCPINVDVKETLFPDQENELRLHFASAWSKGKEAMAAAPKHRWLCWNGDPSRLAVRKAQYHYGWDWGPKLLTCGPWRPIHLIASPSVIEDIKIQHEVSKSLQSAKVSATVTVIGKADYAQLRLCHPGGKFSEAKVKIKNSHCSLSWQVSKPQLWYPRNLGNQHMYSLEVTVLADDQERTREVKRFGLRRVELIQNDLLGENGKSFFFTINNIPTFCGGSNWIPADSFLPRLTKDRYHKLVHLVADGNQNMLRVWGGGIYEDDEFYNACDEMGILIWQDFMFACGNYPTNQTFLDSVEAETVANVKRLRHHPSIIIWAGNNEDYQIMETNKLTYDKTESDPLAWLQTDFPARYIYEKLVPELLEKHAPGSIYRYGSPWGGKTTRDSEHGDLHQWNVWHEKQEPYQNFDKLCGRFVSEFGMQAFPDIEVIKSFIYSTRLSDGKTSDLAEWYSQSSTMDFHNKAADHTRRLATYMTENLRVKYEPVEYYAYLTQLLQSECITSAFSQWKSQWQGEKREFCGGALVWQLNDCWPCISWSIIDYSGRPKLAYYAIKREMSSVSIGMKRVKSQTSISGYSVRVWACSFLQDLHNVAFSIDCWAAFGRSERRNMFYKKNVRLPANRSTELGTFDLPEGIEQESGMNQTVLAARLSEGPIKMAEAINWPEPLRYVHFKRLTFRMEMKEDDCLEWIGRISDEDTDAAVIRVSIRKKRLQIWSEVPIKGLAFTNEDEDVFFGDNGIDVVPGRVIEATIRGINQANANKTAISFLGQY